MEDECPRCSPISIRVAGCQPVSTEPQMEDASSGAVAVSVVRGGDDGGEAPAIDSSASNEERLQQQEQQQPVKRAAQAEAWTLDFSTGGGGGGAKPRRKVSRKEKTALMESMMRRRHGGRGGDTITTDAAPAAVGADSEGNTTTAVVAAVGSSFFSPSSPLPVVSLDGLADRAALVPRDLTGSTRATLEQRLCLRLPRLMCVNKQYPRSCGISSLTSVYNYLYSWIGETPAYAHCPPVSQEEVMTVLGFEPPFGDIPWGGFTGNVTLIRWFYALNKHFGRPSGRAYILYKAHGEGKTTHLFDSDDRQVLTEVKRVLRSPQCALIYHCENHYMCPVGFQEVPLAQTDFLQPVVPLESCETTLFIGEVSRGRHEALYARKWSEVVKDIECRSPEFYNIRKPELGIQSRLKQPPPEGEEGVGVAGGRGRTRTVSRRRAEALAAAPVTEPALATAKPDSTTTTTVVDPLASPSPPPQPLINAAVACHAAGDGGEERQQGREDGQDGAASSAADCGPASTPTPSPTSDTTTTTVGPPAPSRPPPHRREKRASGNLHCLICFRTDDEEVNPGLYEDFDPNASEEEEGYDDQ